MLCVNISVGNRSRTNQLVIGLEINLWTVPYVGVQKSLSVSLSLVSHCRKNSAGQALSHYGGCRIRDGVALVRVSH